MPGHSYVDPSGWTDRIIRTADKTISASTTLVDDGVLQLPVQASAAYFVRLLLTVSAANSTPDIKYTFVVAAGTFEGDLLINRRDTAGALVAIGIIEMSVTSIHGLGNVKRLIHAQGTFRGDTDTLLKLQWAQNASDAGVTTVHAGSELAIKRMG